MVRYSKILFLIFNLVIVTAGVKLFTENNIYNDLQDSVSNTIGEERYKHNLTESNSLIRGKYSKNKFGFYTDINDGDIDYFSKRNKLEDTFFVNSLLTPLDSIDTNLLQIWPDISSKSRRVRQTPCVAENDCIEINETDFKFCNEKVSVAIDFSLDPKYKNKFNQISNDRIYNLQTLRQNYISESTYNYLTKYETEKDDVIKKLLILNDTFLTKYQLSKYPTPIHPDTNKKISTAKKLILVEKQKPTPNIYQNINSLMPLVLIPINDLQALQDNFSNKFRISSANPNPKERMYHLCEYYGFKDPKNLRYYLQYSQQ